MKIVRERKDELVCTTPNSKSNLCDNVHLWLGNREEPPPTILQLGGTGTRHE